MSRLSNTTFTRRCSLWHKQSLANIAKIQAPPLVYCVDSLQSGIFFLFMDLPVVTNLFKEELN